VTEVMGLARLVVVQTFPRYVRRSWDHRRRRKSTFLEPRFGWMERAKDGREAVNFSKATDQLGHVRVRLADVWTLPPQDHDQESI
jgi:hypothetical protein